MTDLVKVKALKAFTYTHITGQYHGDPDNKKAKTVDVPAEAVERLVADGSAELAPAAKPKKDEAPAEPEAEPGEGEADEAPAE